MKRKFSVRPPKPSLVRLCLPTAVLAVVTVALGGASGALADTSISSNWAGYAAHRAGVRFRQVSAEWRQPRASCRSENQTYSAAWVGLGGFNQTSNALEQVGTELDCSASGRVVSSAWYELVPAPSEPINLRVNPGDLMAASVTVVGHRVDIRLADLTRHRSFTKTLYPTVVDVSSAEWIVEAPSECGSETTCQTLPLANFGTTMFGIVRAQSTTGVIGSVASRAWDSTSITLSPNGRRFIAYRGSGASAGAATPSRLASSGAAFSVTYTKISVESNPFFAARRPLVATGYLEHPGR